jgi:hypothetical protein
MRKSPLISVLMALLILSAVASVWYSFQIGRYLKRASQLQYSRNVINRNLAVFQALLNETMDYSKRNPAIDGSLQKFGFKAKSTAPVAPVVATPPAKPTK